MAELQTALVGSWVGTLEYRDYAEPATSTKRVKLPTWLDIEQASGDLHWKYVYDDGPSKTVTEQSNIRIDPTAERYVISDAAGKIQDTYSISGMSALQQGRGTLVLSGTGTENNVAVNVRTTLQIRRNILEITRETGIPGQPYAFRHSYTLVRRSPFTTK